ncbi:hypothetical protein [Kamptonema formosum]|uniref:hypothetical protein n=1 Tax=Kamptonema formosum TaxID=331992 RepID=UPI000345BA4E|nr:hypothetical protein [Oscillatoria sp. PCC 10802]
MELAKQGNPQAIKALLNQSLQPEGISVRVRLKNNCLTVIAESSEPPEKSLTVKFIREKMEDLRPQWAHRVVVHGRAAGNTSTVWRVGFDLYSEPEAPTAEPPFDVSADNPFGPVGSETLSPAPTEETAGPPSSQPQSGLRPLNPALESIKLPLIIGVYAIVTASLVALSFSIKWVAIELAELYIYSIQLVGDMLRAIQIVEVLNIMVFAIFGMGFGAATALLPPGRPRYASTILLIILVPIIASTSDIYGYYHWIDQVALQEKISYQQATEITDSFLMKRAGTKGFLGFYLHTADYPLIPTRTSLMESSVNEKEEVASRFASLARLTPKRMGAIFSIAGWFVRGFYLLVAAVVTAAHYREGIGEVSRIIRQGRFNG